MSAPPKPPPAGGGPVMSLYANLLDPKAADADSASSSDKNSSGGGAGVKKPMLDPATLRFQPIRRPQPAQKQKPKTAVVFHKAPAAAPAGTSATAAAAAGTGSAPPTVTTTASAATDPTAPTATAADPPTRSRLADWTATEEDEYMYGTGAGKRQRGGKKAKRKQNRDGGHQQNTDWDELYDPARPTNVEEYLRSDERIAEIREWKAVLYAHRLSRAKEQQHRRGRSPASSDADEDMGDAAPTKMSNQFAPPPSYSFAPPPPSPPRRIDPQPEEQRARPLASSVPPPADATGDDAYARRMALSGIAPAGSASESDATGAQAASGPAAGATDAATISRAPVKYEAPQATAGGDDMDVDNDYDDDGDDDAQPRAGLGASGGPADGAGQDQQRSNRPGQSGFATRMMEKMGWEKGRGLGAEGNEGIVRGLSVKLDKRKRRPDSEGGGFVQPAGRGRIIGGKLPAAAAGAAASEGKFGRMSEVVVLRGMLDGMDDVAAEVEKGLSQEIGEECGEKYGRVERIYVHVDTRVVFIKFTDQVSALRAVNALEGRVFNGNAIVPAFYDAEIFEQGVYQ